MRLESLRIDVEGSGGRLVSRILQLEKEIEGDLTAKGREIFKLHEERTRLSYQLLEAENKAKNSRAHAKQADHHVDMAVFAMYGAVAVSFILTGLLIWL